MNDNYNKRRDYIMINVKKLLESQSIAFTGNPVHYQLSVSELAQEFNLYWVDLEGETFVGIRKGEIRIKNNSEGEKIEINDFKKYVILVNELRTLLQLGLYEDVIHFIRDSPLISFVDQKSPYLVECAIEEKKVIAEEKEKQRGLLSILGLSLLCSR